MLSLGFPSKSKDKIGSDCIMLKSPAELHGEVSDKWKSNSCLLTNSGFLFFIISVSYTHLRAHET